MKDNDPLAVVTAPPPNESPEHRTARLASEAEAKRISDAIDDLLKAERTSHKKRKPVKLLLLGQSESGKSTTLRQFQRLYTPTAFRDERALWRAVIQLNLVRSVRTILDVLTDVLERSSRSQTISSSGTYRSNSGPGTYRSRERARRSKSRSMSPQALLSGAEDAGGEDSDDDRIPVSEEAEALRMRLLPLRHIETLLIAKLVPPDEDEATHLPTPAAPPPSSVKLGKQRAVDVDIDSWGDPMDISVANNGLAWKHANSNGSGSTGTGNGTSGHSYVNGSNGGSTTRSSSADGSWTQHTLVQPLPTVSVIQHQRERERMRGRANSEVSVRPGTWKGAVAKAAHVAAAGASLSIAGPNPTPPAAYNGGRIDGKHSMEEMEMEEDEVTRVLWELREEIKALWADKTVRDLLQLRKVRLEEQPGFFLNELDRVTDLRYLPSDDDVLRARLKTIGVSEYTLEMEAAAGRDSGAEWRIIDVGGTRSQRPAWVPFFDDVNAIIFLAPISAFDQVLVEDRSVNRLEDSVLLWKGICANKLLQHVDLVLFLNKCDILDRKLKSGIRLAKYLRSYGERVNDVESVSKYLSSKFGAIQREYSPLPRKFYCFSTSVTDITTTAGIIASVRDIVIREHLRQSKLL